MEKRQSKKKPFTTVHYGTQEPAHMHFRKAGSVVSWVEGMR